MSLPSPCLFRAYDVRGIVGSTLHAEDFVAIGHAFASHVADQVQCRTPLILAMHDARTSSASLYAAMVEGMLRGGAHVLDGGMGPTPLCYFATHHLHADGCVMVTGSHNPADHNGAKFLCESLPLHGAELASLRNRIEDATLIHSRGQREEVDLLDEYVAYLRQMLAPSGALEALPLAWDAGNGVAGMVLDALLRGVAAPHATLLTLADGTFPVHHPDPSVPENLALLQRTVTEQGLAFGVAFDGDGDRLGVVDDQGRILSPDHVFMLLADDVLARHPGATILADVKTSDAVFARVRAQGGASLMWKTGHAPIKAKMLETGVTFAGEASGHFFFADSYFGFDDGIYAALRLLRKVAESGQALSALVDALPVLHASPELRIPCDDADKFTVIEQLAAQLTAEGASFLALDGVRVSTPQGWWLVRASNTQAVLVLRAEGASPEATSALLDAAKMRLTTLGVAVE